MRIKLRPHYYIACVLTGLLLSASTAFAASPAPLELMLEEAVKMTLESNPTGKMAVYDFEAAKGALTSARSYRWPTITGTHYDKATWAGKKSNRFNGYDNAFTTQQYINYATANWVLWSGNRIESQVSQAKYTLDSNKWGAELAMQILPIKLSFTR
jgi:outer membrane protein TolC